jgi:hypothetical protein
LGSKDFQNIWFLFSFFLSRYIKGSRIFFRSLRLHSLHFWYELHFRKTEDKAVWQQIVKSVTWTENKYFSTPLYVTLLFFPYFSKVRTRNLENQSLISPSFQISKNVLLLLLLMLLLLMVLLMFYFYFATFSTCPLHDYNHLPYIHTLFHRIFLCSSLYFYTNKSLIIYIVMMPSGYVLLYNWCSNLSSVSAFISQHTESV